jgi:hypothetical protein
VRSHYVFHSEWHVHPDADRVYQALADVAHYPDWWPQVRRVRWIDEHSGEMTCRSTLPYDLSMTAARLIEDPAERVLRVGLSGDLVGWSQWRVAADGRAHFDQEVDVGKGLVRAAGILARPLLRLNHSAMMSGGERGLRAYLAD